MNDSDVASARGFHSIIIIVFWAYQQIMPVQLVSRMTVPSPSGRYVHTADNQHLFRPKIRSAVAIRTYTEAIHLCYEAVSSPYAKCRKQRRCLLCVLNGKCRSPIWLGSTGLQQLFRWSFRGSNGLHSSGVHCLGNCSCPAWSDVLAQSQISK